MGQPFLTENATEIIQELDKVKVVPSANFDCPENALSALKVGLDVALPNSIVYLFTDAPANDYGLYGNVSAVILRKQITVNFLISDGCRQRNTGGYEVYFKISKVSNGLTYEVQKDNIDDVLVAIRDNNNPNFVVLKAIKSNKKIKAHFDIDESISEFKITLAGKDQKYKVKNPSDSEVQAKQKFSTENVKIVSWKNPTKGTWKVEASDDYVEISAISQFKFDFGFSINSIEDKSETVPQPISGIENILSIFISDPSKIDKLSHAVLISVPMSEPETFEETMLDLNKLSDDLYTTDPFSLPKKPFKISLEGKNTEGHQIHRIISPVLYESAGSKLNKISSKFQK